MPTGTRVKGTSKSGQRTSHVQNFSSSREAGLPRRPRKLLLANSWSTSRFTDLATIDTRVYPVPNITSDEYNPINENPTTVIMNPIAISLGEPYLRPCSPLALPEKHFLSPWKAQTTNSQQITTRPRLRTPSNKSGVSRIVILNSLFRKGSWNSPPSPTPLRCRGVPLPLHRAV